jgi:hypothetical protein
VSARERGKRERRKKVIEREELMREREEEEEEEQEERERERKRERGGR